MPDSFEHGFGQHEPGEANKQAAIVENTDKKLHDQSKANNHSDLYQQIQRVSRYMDRDQAKSLARRYEYLELSSGVDKEGYLAVIVSIATTDMYETFVRHGWFSDPPPRDLTEPDGERLPIPKPGDWAVVVSMYDRRHPDGNSWVAADGYAPGGLLGDVIKQYGIEL